MKDAFMPFGAGTRGKQSVPVSGAALTPFFSPVCIGLHLARFEIALGAITFLRAYPTARIAARTTDADMEFENFFLIAPKAHKCLVVL
jgi:hypothetical protein